MSLCGKGIDTHFEKFNFAPYTSEYSCTMDRRGEEAAAFLAYNIESSAKKDADIHEPSGSFSPY